MFITKTVNSPKEILMYNDYKGKPYTVSAIGVSANAEGKKIVKAGTVLPANDATAEGILLTDVDVTNGNATGTVCYEGTFSAAKLLANGVTVADTAKAVLPRVTIL